MPSRPQANPNRLSIAASWLRRHPGVVFLGALALTIVLYHTGFLTPADWWGDGMEVRR